MSSNALTLVSLVCTSSPGHSTCSVSAPPKEVADKDSPTVSSAVPSSDTHSEGPLLPATLRRCPPYRYRHDDKRVVFVLDVRDVNPGTVVTHFDDSWVSDDTHAHGVQSEGHCMICAGISHQ